MERYEVIWNDDGRSCGFIEGNTLQELTQAAAAIARLQVYINAHPNHGSIRIRHNDANNLIIGEDFGNSPGWVTLAWLMKRAITIKPAKKVISDRCKKCNVPGVWGARANLLCPICKAHIGGLS